MSKNIFLISDTHFGHLGVCQFLNDDGEKMRPWDCPEEMDEFMVQQWNDTVDTKDKVYHLGDVAMARKSLKILSRLNGDKVLIRGNHDIFKLKDYTEHFRDVRATHVLDGLIFTHIPIHSSQIRRFGCNIHGHLHSNRVMMTDEKGQSVIDPNYLCVCVEQTGYTPLALEDALLRIESQGGCTSFRSKGC